ncbi:hypothetical protein QCA50_007114 [Cerrena zonata]|uniref:Uncharacterized protein n=1 Tax=Cerrena zonata TaxID=2478898 RepID=A0AAW0G7E5_9APHY
MVWLGYVLEGWPLGEKTSSSWARTTQEGDEDWTYHYVNIFVDRDMFMRHMGDGVGYRKTHVRSPSPDGNSKAENIPLNGEEDGDERVAQDEEDM